MFIIEYRDIGWWYWLITACLLTFGVTGNPECFSYAIVATLFQLVYFIICKKSVTAFPIQVRFWYLMLLLISLPEQMQLVYWVPTIGTWAQIFFGYCTMARCVSLLPWNRTEVFSLNLVRTTFISRPARGNILQGFETAK